MVCDESMPEWFLQRYQILASISEQKLTHLYKIKPKFHHLQHLLDWVVKFRINPGRFSCWSDEDFLGKLKRIARSCNGRAQMLRTMQKYISYLAVRWGQRRRCGRFLMPERGVGHDPHGT